MIKIVFFLFILYAGSIILKLELNEDDESIVCNCIHFLSYLTQVAYRQFDMIWTAY